MFNDMSGNIKLAYWLPDSDSFSSEVPFESVLYTKSPCDTLPQDLRLLRLHSSITADFNNDCVSDLLLETAQSPSAVILFAILSDKEIKYCPMNMDDTDLSNLSGFVTSDFDGDGLLDIAGFNQE